MSVSRGLKRVAVDSATSRLQWLRANAAGYFALLGRRPRFAVRPAWRSPGRLAVGAVLVVVIMAATMTMIDAPVCRCGAARPGMADRSLR